MYMCIWKPKSCLYSENLAFTLHFISRKTASDQTNIFIVLLKDQDKDEDMCVPSVKHYYRVLATNEMKRQEITPQYNRAT